MACSLISRRLLNLIRPRILQQTCTVLSASQGTTPFSTTRSPQNKMDNPKFQMAERLAGTDKNVWVVFGKVAVENKALNLGQGFPDFFPPEYVRDALITAAKSDNPFLMQYTRSYGHPRLVKALADTFSPLMGREINPMDEVLITVGAYGSLFCAIQGFVNPGEEVIIIEPYFDCYEPMVNVARGTPVFVPLRPTKKGDVLSSSEWKLDPEELASKFNSKTKAIVLNNPNNPLGKVYTKEELEMIADLCKKHNVICIADEVYEWLIYEGNKHLKIANLPGMWERTITIGSAGKTFSVTGWKLGWTIGPEYLIHALRTVHQNCNYTCPTPIQEAVAYGFELEKPRMGSPECYYLALPVELQPKRDMLAKCLQEVGLIPVVPEGGYFMIADISKLDVNLGDENKEDTKDFRFAKWMAKHHQLATIPISAFYSPGHKHLASDLIRFCFIKDDKTLGKAADIMRKMKSSLH